MKLMDFGIVEIFICLATIFGGFYVYVRRMTYDYWKKRGVPGPLPSLPFGNFAGVFLRLTALPDKLQEMYEAYKEEPFIGYFAGSHPILMVKDPDLIKNVLIKDFSVFSGRGITVNENEDPLSAHLFNLDGLRWKVLRHKLTPIFTTGKLKQMFYLMAECGNNFEIYLKKKVSEKKIIEIREAAARYSTDVIGSCVFGFEAKALADEESIFREMGRKMFEPSFVMQIKRMMREIAPRIFELLRLKTVKPEVTDFFINVMRETIDLRSKEKTVRNDFVDLLMAISKDSVADGFEWTDHLLTAQAFVFFAAGFETSSTTISFALWELARESNVQEKLRQEILEFDRKIEGKFTYEIVNDMKYLDMVVKETLRKNPPVTELRRVATQEYTIPGTKVTIPVGQSIAIPVWALHTDPKYYPKPEVFDPQRFSEEAKQTRHSMVFLPFGDGPKNCIGSRFGYYQVKLGLIKVLKNFRVKPTSDELYVIDKNTVILAPIGGLRLEFESLEN